MAPVAASPSARKSSIIIFSPGYQADEYDAELEWRQSEFGWTQDQFDKYWDNGGEEEIIKNMITQLVECYDDECNWEELKNREW